MSRNNFVLFGVFTYKVLTLIFFIFNMKKKLIPATNIPASSQSPQLLASFSASDLNAKTLKSDR